MVETIKLSDLRDYLIQHAKKNPGWCGDDFKMSKSKTGGKWLEDKITEIVSEFRVKNS
jgi:hypothetical protein